jgi:hypothetical protein
MSDRKRFLVVGGIPFRSYTGTGTFTGLRLVGATDSQFEVAQLVDDNYDACGGLIDVFDLDNLHLSGDLLDQLGLTAEADESEVDESERDTLPNIPAVLSYPVPPV